MDMTSTYLCEILTSLYNEIEVTRMDNVPILNKNLSVAALGFEPYNDYALGVLLTPWFMNLVLVPLDQEEFIKSSPQETSKHTIILPAGQVEFIVSFEEGFGWYLTSSLYSPMFEFEDQAAALQTAEAALQEILNDSAELEAPEQDMQDIWEGKLPKQEEETNQSKEISPPKDLDRRTFLRGKLGGEAPKDKEAQP